MPPCEGVFRGLIKLFPCVMGDARTAHSRRDRLDLLLLGGVLRLQALEDGVDRLLRKRKEEGGEEMGSEGGGGGGVARLSKD